MSDKNPILLAVETSGMEGGLAVTTAIGQVIELRLGADGRRHAQTLVSEAGQLLNIAGLEPAQIDVVAVSNGPGSFTGLRVGTVFAKTMAWANEAKLVDVDTLQVIACATDPTQPIVTAISDAQRSEVFINRYSQPDADGIRQPLDKLTIVPVEQLRQQFTESHFGILTGPALNRFSNQLTGCRHTESNCWLPQAKWVLAIGQQLVRQNLFADVATLEPVYVRRSYAEEKAG